MKTLVLLAVVALAPTTEPTKLPCDWQVSRKVDTMTDQQKCMIHSPSAHLGIGVREGRVSFYSGSAYTYDYLTIRVDDWPAVQLPEHNRPRYGDEAAKLLSQIRTGSRIRVEFRDYPQTVSGEAAICELPKLISDCL